MVPNPCREDAGEPEHPTEGAGPGRDRSSQAAFAHQSSQGTSPGFGAGGAARPGEDRSGAAGGTPVPAAPNPARGNLAEGGDESEGARQSGWRDPKDGLEVPPDGSYDRDRLDASSGVR